MLGVVGFPAGFIGFQAYDLEICRKQKCMPNMMRLQELPPIVDTLQAFHHPLKQIEIKFPKGKDRLHLP